jgi:hypothetical protein
MEGATAPPGPLDSWIGEVVVRSVDIGHHLITSWIAGPSVKCPSFARCRSEPGDLRR